MCGRYALYGPRSRTRAEIEYFPSLDQFPDSWNVAPTDVGPITRLHNGSVEQISARWGLIPYWAKDEKIGFKCINARAETVATLPAFRGAYKLGHRCLIPACGFFEWETRPDGKQPFYFTGAEGSLLAFAGLWDKWRKPDGSEVLSYTIITTAPNDFVARFHDRMPVVLDERDYGRWLEGSGNPQDLLRACHNETLYNYPVSRQVNSVRKNDASLVVPLESNLALFGTTAIGSIGSLPRDKPPSESRGCDGGGRRVKDLRADFNALLEAAPVFRSGVLEPRSDQRTSSSVPLRQRQHQARSPLLQPRVGPPNIGARNAGAAAAPWAFRLLGPPQQSTLVLEQNPIAALIIPASKLAVVIGIFSISSDSRP